MERLTEEKAKEYLKKYIKEGLPISTEVIFVKKEEVYDYVKKLNTTYYILTWSNPLFTKARGEIVKAINLIKDKYQAILIQEV